MNGAIRTSIRYQIIRIRHRPLKALIVTCLLLAAGLILYRAWALLKLLNAEVWLRVIGYAAIPSVMAWAGLHLAADIVKSRTTKFLFRALFICLAALGILIVAVVEKRADKDHRDEVDYQRKQYEYQRDQNARMTQLLLDGQQKSGALQQEIQGWVSDLRATIGKASRNPGTSAIELSQLEQRAQQAEQSAKILGQFYSAEHKKQSWPFGASGADHPGLHEWFLTNFQEASNLNGEDRFFLYYLLKHGGELRSDQMKDFRRQYDAEFTYSAMSGAEERLKRSGFIESWDDVPFEQRAVTNGLLFALRLKEPYYSRFRKMIIP